jgi:hypothetical protein
VGYLLRALYCADAALKQLENELHDKDIAFVSVAVDGRKARNTWLKMIAKNKWAASSYSPVGAIIH